MNIQEEVIRAMNWHKDMHDRTFLHVHPSGGGRRPSKALTQGLRNGVITATEAMSIRPVEGTFTATEIGAPRPTTPANKQIPNPKS